MARSLAYALFVFATYLTLGCSSPPGLPTSFQATVAVSQTPLTYTMYLDTPGDRNLFVIATNAANSDPSFQLCAANQTSAAWLYVELICSNKP